MKKQKKLLRHKITRVAVVVAIVATLFALCCIPCLAFTTGQYTSPIGSGYVTTPFINMRSAEYITILSSGTALWKSIPLQDDYNVSGLSNFGGYDIPLANPVGSQVIFSDEVYQSFGPLSMYSVPFDYDDLDELYLSSYPQGNLDINHIYVQSKRDTAGYAREYQRLKIRFEDVYMTHDMYYGDAVSGYTPFSLYQPAITAYSISPNTPVFWALSGVIQYRTDLGTIESIDIAPSWVTAHTGNTLTSGLYTAQVRPVTALMNQIPEASRASVYNSDYIRIVGLDFTLGLDTPDIPSHISTGDYSNGVYAASILQPCIRPYVADDNFVYDDDVNFNIRNAFGSAYNYVDELDVSPFGSFITKTVGSITSIELYPGFTIGGILFTILAVSLTIAVLKFFAGG